MNAYSKISRMILFGGALVAAATITGVGASDANANGGFHPYPVQFRSYGPPMNRPSYGAPMFRPNYGPPTRYLPAYSRPVYHANYGGTTVGGFQGNGAVNGTPIPGTGPSISGGFTGKRTQNDYRFRLDQSGLTLSLKGGKTGTLYKFEVRR